MPDSPPAPAASRPGRGLLVVAACIVTLAGALRFAGLGFGLPMAESRPDEMTIAFQAMKFGTGDLNPHSFNYPSLHKYISFVLFGVYYVFGKLSGHFAGQEDFLREFFDGAVRFRLLMRAWSALAGTATVALLLGFPRGPAAALLLAVAFLPVRDSHFGVTDTTMVALATAAVLLCARVREGATWRRVLGAAVVAGLATSTKYNAALLALPLTVAIWTSPGAGKGPRTLVAALAMVGAFLVGTPYALLDAQTFFHDFSYEANHLLTGQYVDVGGGWSHHLDTLLLTQGWPFLLSAAGGLALAFRRSWKDALVLYGFPLAYYLAIGRGETAFFRYILPVMPFLCVAAAEGLAALRPLGFRLIGFVVVASPSFAGSVAEDKLLQAGDTRDAMGAWIEANVPADAVLVHAGAYTGAPMLQRNEANQTREYLAKAGRADAAGFRKPDDPRWYNRERPAYDVQFVAKEGIDFASQRSVDELLADPPPYLLVETYFLTHYSAVPDEVRTLAAERYTELHVESATDGDVGDPVFDQQDAFYLPASGFKGFTRVGPTLHLYRRNMP